MSGATSRTCARSRVSERRVEQPVDGDTHRLDSVLAEPGRARAAVPLAQVGHRRLDTRSTRRCHEVRQEELGAAVRERVDHHEHA